MQTIAFHSELTEMDLDLVTGGGPDAGASPDAGPKPDGGGAKTTPPKTTTTTKVELRLDATLKDSPKEGTGKEIKGGITFSHEVKKEK